MSTQNKFNPLVKAIRTALIAGAAISMAATGSALAEEADGDEAEEENTVTVTGSRIKRTDIETASPVSVFTSEDIQASGLTTLEDFVQNMPAMNGGMLGSTVNNGNPGFATAAIRGLGSGRTLTLINGRRFNSNDLNSIPTSFIDRVEVVRDGASTIYGSDAIAGVINFITKRDFEGMEMNLQYDITGESDGEQTKFSIVTGASSDKGNVVFSLDYTNRKAIGQGDRAYSECPIWDDGPGTSTYCGGSSHTNYGRINVPVGGLVNGVPRTADDPGSYVIVDGEFFPYNAADYGFNYAALSYLVTPQKVFTMNAASSYELTDDITAIAEAGYASRTSDQLMAPVATFWSAPVPADSPYNPTGVDVSVNRRLTETGGRNFTQDANDYRLVFGLEGYFDNGITWDVSYNYSRFIDARIVAGQINRPRMETLLSPTLCSADENCPEVWDPFTRNTLTQEMIDYASVTHSPVVRGTTTQFMANIQGDISAFELPGGQIQWAAGIERRTESLLSQPDGAAALGQIYFVSGQKTEGQYDVDESYVEFNLPILSGVSMAERLNVSLAARSSDFSNQPESTTNSKFGIEWMPNEDILVRATWAEGFRAPSIGELFAPQTQSAQSYTDPCWNWTENTNPTIVANCGPGGDNLPANFESDTQAAAVLGGNPDLEPEKSESFTAGFVYTGIENLTLAVDFFDIEITDGVGTAGTDNIGFGCYESENFSSPLCDLILGHQYGPIDTPPHPTSPRRNVNGILSGILLTNANLATFQTSGIDFDVTYKMEFDAGMLDINLAGSILDDYSYSLIAGDDMVQAAGYVAEDQWVGNPAVFSKHRANLGLTWSQGDYAINLNTRYQSGGDDINFTCDDILDCRAESVVYHDLQGVYYFSDNYSVTLGVRNLTDKLPPYISTYDDMNTINYSYDLAGQYWYLKASASF